MTAEELARMVLLMRQLQVSYFKTKDTGVLQDCKRQEKAVDAAVAKVLNPPPPTLFDADACEGE